MGKGPTTMATEPTATPKKRKSSGPRVVKDRVVFALFKGTIENLQIVDDPMAALDLKEAQPDLTYRKIVIPARKNTRNKPAADTATA